MQYIKSKIGVLASDW